MKACIDVFLNKMFNCCLFKLVKMGGAHQQPINFLHGGCSIHTHTCQHYITWLCAVTMHKHWRGARRFILLCTSREACLWRACPLQLSFDSTPSTWFLQPRSLTAVRCQQHYYCILTTRFVEGTPTTISWRVTREYYIILCMQHSSCVRTYVCTCVQHIATATYARSLQVTVVHTHSGKHTTRLDSLCARSSAWTPTQAAFTTLTTSVRVSSTL